MASMAAGGVEFPTEDRTRRSRTVRSGAPGGAPMNGRARPRRGFALALFRETVGL